MLLRRWAHEWGSTPAERAVRYPAQDLLDGHLLHRAIDVAAPAEVAFRWLCQLTVAPYSYDWLDNGGRRSPGTLSPVAEQLVIGQHVMRIFELVAFEPGRSMTLVVVDRKALRMFGPLAVTYQVNPLGSSRARYVAVLVVGSWGIRGRALAYGDAVMMRKQLRTLARLASARA